MLTVKRLGWTALLIVIQPVKVLVTTAALLYAVAYDVGREFVRDFRSIWQR
jgi:hypothetical protein